MDTTTQIIVAIIGGVFSLLGIVITSFVVPWLKTKAAAIKNENARKAALAAIDLAGATVTTTVNALSQTLVASYKKDGKWNDETKAEVKKVAIEQIKNALTSEQVAAILSYSKLSIEDWIAAQVESYIHTDDPNAVTK